MAQNEIYSCPTCGRSKRDGERAYNAFHRTNSAKRFIGVDRAKRLYTSNIDKSIWLETHAYKYRPVALIESAQYCGHTNKSDQGIRYLASGFSPYILPAYIVLYTLADDFYGAERDISELRIRRVWPDPITNWSHAASPQEYFEWLEKVREKGLERILECEKKPGDNGKYNHDISRLRAKCEAVPPLDLWDTV